MVAAVAMALATIPSVILYNTTMKYFGFMHSWKVGTLRPTKTKGVPVQRLPALRNSPPPRMEVRFVNFSVKAPAAKKVRISADFNRWTPGSLTLNRTNNGTWEAIVPLPTGRYNYLYEVDGVLMMDPRNPSTGYYEDKQTSVITVK